MGKDFYDSMREATQSATKDPVSFVEGKLLSESEYSGGRPVPAAGTGVWPAYNNLGAAEHVIAQARFTYGSGGVSAKFYLQSSLDGELTWFDVVCWAFSNQTARLLALSGLSKLNPTVADDGTLQDNKSASNVLGDVFRVKYVVVGAYVDSFICIAGIAKSF